ncbi:MAG TPA: hypothetical protein VF270_12405, partial [Ignavibacteriaceae bacterium]
MKNFTIFFTVIFLVICFSLPSYGQANYNEGPRTQIEIPAVVQSLLDQIKTAEQNEDWDQYYLLRSKLIEAWQNIDPAMAALYRSTNSPEADQMNSDAPHPGEGGTGAMLPLWGDDLIVHTGTVIDLSLVNTRSDTLYLAALNSGGNSVDIYRSGDGGDNWTVFKSNFSLTDAQQVELLDFDGFTGSTGPSYVLMFSRYSTGRLYCTRFDTYTGGYQNSVVVESGCTDFAVDRSFPSGNYRCFVVYDSASTQYHKRSDPSSYATVWQDKIEISSCEDPDISYGLNGTMYLAYIGRNSGNLYENSNYNYGDPTAFFNQRTVEYGATDTTYTPEIIASKQDTSQQTIVMVYDWLNNGRYDLRTVKKTGGSGWTQPINWSSSTGDNKYIHLFCKKSSNNDVFQATFTRTGLANALPRAIRYREYSSGAWVSSIQVSDDAITVTGVQSSMVTQLNSGIAAFAYAGSSGANVYFDREDRVTDVSPDAQVPEQFILEQNYPNPFNPVTTIKYQIPSVTLRQTQSDIMVSLKVYDVLGNEVATLVNEEKPAGMYNVEFRMNNLS